MRAARLLLLRRPMQSGSRFDVSAILPFGDDEDVIGAAITRVATLLRGLGLGFEILAVDENSGDNSHAVLALLRAQVPELRVVHAPGRGRGFDTGVARAQGRAVWLVTPTTAAQPTPGFARALEQIRDDGPADAAVIRGRFAVVHRTRALDAATGLRGIGDVYFRKLARRLAARGLRVDIQGILGGAAPARSAAAAPERARGLFRIARIFGAEKNT